MVNAMQDSTMMMDDDDDDDMNSIDNAMVSNNQKLKMKSSKKTKNKSIVEKFAIRQQTISEYRHVIARISEQVMCNPQKNIYQLKKLINLLTVSRDDDAKFGIAFFTIQKLTFLSLNLTFMDIIPNYRINKRGEQTSASALKNETRHLLDFEHNLLKYYYLYLKRLKCVMNVIMEKSNRNKNKSNGLTNFYIKMLATYEAKKKLALIGCHCISELIRQHYNFNYFEILFNLSAKILCNPYTTNEMKDIIIDGLKILFQNDLLGEKTLIFIRLFTNMIMEQNYHVSPKALTIFLHLKFSQLNENNFTANTKSNKTNRNNKQLKRLEKQLLETEACENKESRKKYELNIHETVYIFYIKFLDNYKQELSFLSSKSSSNNQQIHTNSLRKWYRPLLSTILDSIIKLAMYSNEEFVFDLIERLKSFFNFNELQSYDKLILMKNIYILMSHINSISSLTKTLNQFDYKFLYQTLYEFSIDDLLQSDGENNTDNQPQESIFSLYIECINVMVIKMIRYQNLISLNRIMNFVCKFLLLSTENKLNASQKLVFLYAIRKCIDHKRWPNFNDEDDDDENCMNDMKNIRKKFTIDKNEWKLSKNIDGDVLLNQNSYDFCKNSFKLMQSILRWFQLNESSSSSSSTKKSKSSDTNGYVQLLITYLNDNLFQQDQHMQKHQQKHSLIKKFVKKYQLDFDLCETLLLNDDYDLIDLYNKLEKITDLN